MEYICPLCNGLFSEIENCPKCGHDLLNQGKTEDFWGPYSPYQDEEIYLWQQEIQHPELGEDYCQHLFSCPVCSYDKKLAIRLINI